jgi:hypothetical protein
LGGGRAVNITAIDTHEIVKDLTAAGLTELQAEAVTRAVRKAQDIDLSHLATKADVEGLRRDIEAVRLGAKTDTESLRVELNANIENLRIGMNANIENLRISGRADLDATKTEILKWVVSTIGLQTVVILGAVVGLVKLLAH